MSQSRYTTTAIPGGGRYTIHFSGEVPAFNVAYIPPPEATRQTHENHPHLSRGLGHAAIAPCNIEGSQNRVGALEALVMQNQVALERQPTPVSSRENPHTEAVVPAQSNLPESAAQSEAQSNEKLKFKPDESLSPIDQRAELAILHLLGCPDLAIIKPNASKDIRDEYGFSSHDWGNLQRKLEKMGIIETELSATHAKRLGAISLNLEGLTAAVDKAFVTPRILSVLKSAAKTITETTTPQPSAPTEAPSPTANGSSNGNSQKHQISSRVRKLLDEPPAGESSYRHRGKGAKKLREKKPFLEHRRQTTGTRRRK